MAVEIPVYIDIKGAIDQASKQLPSGIKELQNVVSQNTLNLKFDVMMNKQMTLNELLFGKNTDIYDLRHGLMSIRAEFDKISQAAAKNPKADPWLRKTKELANAYGLVEQRITGVSSATKAASLMVEHNITKVRTKIDELKAKLGTLQSGTDVWRKTNYEIQLQEQKLAQLNGQLRAYRIATTDANSALSTQGRLLGQVNGLLSTYVSVFGLLRFAKQIRDVTGELEYQRVALGHLIQDEEYGNKLFSEIQAKAIESPFRIKDLVTYTKQLAAYQVAQEDLIDTMSRLSDISAGLGVDMNRLILAYGQVRAASVLRGQELRQFTEAGIPMVELLAEKFRELGREGTTTADVFKLISERAVPFSMVAEIFEDLTDKGGMFYKMQEEQVKTLKGSWEKLKDTFDIALQSIGETQTFERYNKIILNTLTIVANNIRIIPKLLNALTRGWLAYRAAILLTNIGIKQTIPLEVALAASRRADATRIGKITMAILTEARARELLTKAYAKQQLATNALSKSFWKLTAAMLSNPIGAAIAGIAALTGLFFTFQKKVDDTASDLEQYEKAVENVTKAENEYAKRGKLIDRYEQLSKKTDRTAKENNKLHETVTKLKDSFPSLVDAIDDENMSLDEQIAKLRYIQELDKAKAEKAAQDSYALAKKDLEDALAKQKELQKSYESALAWEKAFDQSNEKRNERKWRKRTQERKAELEEQEKDIEKLYDYIERLEEQLFPEKANKNLIGWRKQLSEVQEEKVKLGASPIFTSKEIQELESVYDLFKKLKKEWEDATESLEGMQAAYDQMEGSEYLETLGGEIGEMKVKIQLLEAMRDLFGFDFSKKTSGSTAYTQDPFIQNMQDRIKYMQDFKKGYDDLNKYMNKAAALDKQATNMLTRGLSLGLNANEQMRAAEQLSEWYSAAIQDAFKQAQKYGAGADLTAFLSRQITGSTNRDKALRDFQQLIQSLYDAQTDLNTSELKKNLEESFKKMSDELKRSETVRNFYQNILDMTGDQELATSLSVSVYGGIGEDFKERMQRQLNEALSSVDPSQLTDTLKEAIDKQDFAKILENLDVFPQEWHSMLKQMATENEKFNADIVSNLLKTLQSAKTYSQQRVELARQTAQRLSQIEERNIPEETKQTMKKQNLRKEAEESAKLAYEAFKDTPMYIELFANLDTASTRMLRNMRDNLVVMQSQWKELTPTEIKELQSRIEELDKQLASKNPFKAIIESIRDYRDLMEEQSREEADLSAITANNRLNAERAILEEKIKAYETAVAEYGIESEQAKAADTDLRVQEAITDEVEQQAKDAQELANKYRLVTLRIQQAAEQMKEWNGYITEALTGVSEIVETFASADTADTFNTLSEGLTKTLGGIANIGVGIGQMLTNPIAGAASIISGIGSVIGGIFGTANALKMKRINNEIEEQDDILHNLEKSYDALEKATAGAFGSDYVYNYTEQLKNLEAQQAAYLKQAELEREKGKKADEAKIKEYEESAADTYSKIQDMQSQLAEHFAGTDVTSAARDFAKSWIDAYREFGNTTMAMREKFKEMIDNMIVESLAGKIIKDNLMQVYDLIDEYSEGGLDAKEIADIARLAETVATNTTTDLSALMQELASYGLNMRGTAGGFSGIAKDIAGASEQSINGLAAGINTQNYYMSYMPAISADVALIRAAIAGEVPAVATPTAATVESQFGDELFRGQMSRLDTNIAEIRNLLASVVSLPNTPTNTKVIAAKI
jgi:gas vesicle protein